MITDKAGDYKFPLRETKDKSERSLENIGINYIHMFDTKTEDDTLVLNELDSVLVTEPTLEELDKAADYY